jgi:hypothetical protein
VRTLQVTDGTLQALAVPPVIGRWFSREDDAPGSPESIVLTHAYWQRRYGGDRSVIGRTVIVDARPRTVIAVMPAGFRFLNEAPDLILPFRFDRRTLLPGGIQLFRSSPSEARSIDGASHRRRGSHERDLAEHVASTTRV